MAYSAASKWVNVTSLDELNRRLERVPAEAAKEVRWSNRVFANQLRDDIRAATPTTGGSVRHPHPWSRANERTGKPRRPSGRRGAMRTSIKSKVSADYAAVVGGGSRAPHFIVNEFGGGAKFTNRAGRKQYIPVRARSDTIKSLGIKGRTGGGAAGWFFFPTYRKKQPELEKMAVETAMKIVTHNLTKR